MAFGAGDSSSGLDTGIIGRNEMEIACECWFTSKGKMQPLLIKYQDEQGEIHTIREILVHAREDKDLLTSPYTEFDVTINCHGIGMRVKLVFYKRACKWMMVTGKD